MADAAFSSDDFLITSLSKCSVLVLGDGNFSFSLSLAVSCSNSGFDTPLVLTSLDNYENLKQDVVANGNLKVLENFENVNVLHQVDATNLSQHFPDQYFGRIIFNFPHAGGKSNIKKCRKLLEDFFCSAVEHLVPCEGDICVTLCKGQGGTPLDQPYRSHGNSWQIVNNAAKAGLILTKVFPFEASDYPYYKSAGYRNRITKSFHTSGGLVHVFRPGVKVDPIQDLSGETAEVVLAHIFEQINRLKKKSLCDVPGHPLNLLKHEIQDIWKSMDHMQTSFEAVAGNGEDAPCACNLNCNYSVTAGREIPFFHNPNFMPNITIQDQKILSALKNHGSFIFCDSDLAVPVEVTQTSHIIANELIIGKLFDKRRDCGFLEADTELQVVLERFKKFFNISSYTKYLSQNSVEKTGNETDSKISIWTNSSQVAHLAKRKRHRNSENNMEKCSTPNENQVLCNCRALYHKYLGKHTQSNFQQLTFSELVLQETLQTFRSSSTVVLVSGHLNCEVLEKSGIEKGRHGWLIKINLNALAMARYHISDIRLLWSGIVKMERQSTAKNKEDELTETPGLTVRPLSLFPPSYVHDISFWVSDEISQELFITAAIGLTENCVKEIKLTEVYHDEEKHWLSFNYRMIYSRPDGPLSHLEAVEFQNRLRRALIVLKFGLK